MAAKSSHFNGRSRFVRRPIFAPFRRRFFRPPNPTIKPTPTQTNRNERNHRTGPRPKRNKKKQAKPQRRPKPPPTKRNSRNHRCDRNQHQPREAETEETTAATENDADATQSNRNIWSRRISRATKNASRRAHPGRREDAASAKAF